MRNEIGMGMGEVHARAYRRLLDHYPPSALKPRLVLAAQAAADDRGARGSDA